MAHHLATPTPCLIYHVILLLRPCAGLLDGFPDSRATAQSIMDTMSCCGNSPDPNLERIAVQIIMLPYQCCHSDRGCDAWSLAQLHPPLHYDRDSSSASRAIPGTQTL
ncbi:hypothetical protein VHEMI05315 [[Torrubiella] hemipterigena]|uniref:Uncharacterized protein n=1 Tax=[Torrubiella] hemipterigena TaxID=1531966 RepID=A0A0A1T3R4_9HYPO|nr:hypothetical protein VHEMI05315 [[Torrubiella] hemipterigena]